MNERAHASIRWRSTHGGFYHYQRRSITKNVTTQPGKNEGKFWGYRRSGRVTLGRGRLALCERSGEGDYPEKQEGRMGSPRKAAVRPTKTFLEFFLRVSV